MKNGKRAGSQLRPGYERGPVSGSGGSGMNAAAPSLTKKKKKKKERGRCGGSGISSDGFEVAEQAWSGETRTRNVGKHGNGKKS